MILLLKLASYLFIFVHDKLKEFEEIIQIFPHKMMFSVIHLFHSSTNCANLAGSLKSLREVSICIFYFPKAAKQLHNLKL